MSSLGKPLNKDFYFVILRKNAIRNINSENKCALNIKYAGTFLLSNLRCKPSMKLNIIPND